MKSDIQIAQEAKMKNIREIAAELNLSEDDIDQYGKYKCKISLDVLERNKDNKKGKLVLVTAINPTPAGEGKSTVTIGLGQALNKRNKKAIVALREPSLGPVFGMKGGAAGGGYAQVSNGGYKSSFHRRYSCNNNSEQCDMCAIDNHIYQGNECKNRSKKNSIQTSLDINDRALRDIR